MTQQVKPTPNNNKFPSWPKSQDIPRANNRTIKTKRRRQEDFYGSIPKKLTPKDSMTATILESVLNHNRKDTSASKNDLCQTHLNEHVLSHSQNNHDLITIYPNTDTTSDLTSPTPQKNSSVGQRQINVGS